jgi:hypothetical protein
VRRCSRRSAETMGNCCSATKRAGAINLHLDSLVDREVGIGFGCKGVEFREKG